MKTRYSLRTAAVAFLCLGGIGLSTKVAAVELSATGQGQALIFPYYNAVADRSSLLSVSHGALRHPGAQPNREGRLSAVQISLPLKQGGRKAFVVYLPDGATWTAAIRASGEDSAELVSSDLSCTHPARVSSVEPLTLADLAPAGHVEVFALGELPYTSDLAQAALPEFPIYRDVDSSVGPEARINCAAIAMAWAGGVWSQDPSTGLLPPRNSLSGAMQIVDLSRGLGLTTSTVALADFSATVLHRDVQIEAVDWGDVNPAVSKVDTPEGELESSWMTPVDAVTAVLMADTVFEYWHDPSLTMSTDVVVTLPTRSLYAPSGAPPFGWSGSDTRPKLKLGFLDRSGRPHGQIGPIRSKSTPKCSPPVDSDDRAPLDLPLMVLTQGVESSLDASASAILDSAGFDRTCGFVWVVVPPEPFNGRVFASSVSAALVSVEGHAYNGIPGIVTALTRSIDSFDGKSFGFQLPSTRHVNVVLPVNTP